VAKAWPRTLRYAENAMEPGKLPLAGMIVAVGSRNGEFRGLQRHFLKPDGRPCRGQGGEKLKLSLGDIRCGSAKFWTTPDPERRWGIAEGAETTLAAEQLYQFSVESGVSSGNMQNVIPPAWARHVTIFGDNDNGGIIAAAECKKRYSAIPTIESLRVLIPTVPGTDMADVLIEGAPNHAA
jgi:putative DNA primase/helicase